MSLRNARRTVQRITGFSCNSVHVREGGTDVKVRREKRAGIPSSIRVYLRGLNGKNPKPLLVGPVALSADDGQQCRRMFLKNL